MGFFNAERPNGFDQAIESSLERILTDPEFLFRIERDPASVAPGSIYRLTDRGTGLAAVIFPLEQHSRRRTAGSGGPRQAEGPRGTEAAGAADAGDPRSKALVDNFVGEWLEFRNIQNVTPDQNVFPRFDENLRHAFEQETKLFVESQLREDHSVVDLLTANYTFVNERLAKVYGIPNVAGDRFRRVQLTDPQRAGILGQGSILAVTSYPNRTSPVLRGKFLLSNILGTPPSPPPPVVPGFPDRGEGGKPASVRARFEQHRRNPTCAACHQPMDPSGLCARRISMASENGGLTTPDQDRRLRQVAQRRGVRRSGRIADAASRAPPAVCRNCHRKAARVRARSRNRVLRSSGGPEDRSESAPTDYRWSSVILNIVESVPFQMRKSRSDASSPSGVTAAARR